VSKLSVSSHLNEKKMDVIYPVIRIDRFGDEDMFEVADGILFPL
jgi:hypothetical protein